jgi:glutamyl-tRNA synthetase
MTPRCSLAAALTQTKPHHKFRSPLLEISITHTTTKMKPGELSKLADGLAAPDFKTIEPHLLALDKHLTLRSYVDGYSLGEVDHNIWITLRTNKVANAFLKKGALVNLSRWFTYIEQTHPEIQEEIKAKDEAEKTRKANLSKAGGSYSMALQDTEKGVVTRFPPEPS